MAKKKFTQLTEATLPLGGGEIIALVQGGESKRATLNDVIELVDTTELVESVTGDPVDNSDPLNPNVRFTGIEEAILEDNVIDTDASIEVSGDTAFSIGSPSNPFALQFTGAGTVALNLGSDASGDMYRRSSTGILERRTPAQVLSDIAALPLSGGTLTGALTLNADPTIALHAATKQYVDGLVVGLWDDRGNFDASGGAYPSSGGSGTGGAILKGDVWTISVAGTLPTGQVVQIGDTVRALIDTPGNTQANWAIGQTNFTYTPGNGLTLTGADEFKLGGAITENTTFSGSGFNITWGSSGTRLGNYRVWSNGTIGLDGNTTAFLQTGSNTIATTTAGISVGTIGPILLNTNAGTAGQVLTSAGAAAPPTWSAIGSGSVDNTIWKVGGNTLSGAAILGSTSAQDITMTVGNANYKLSVNGVQVLNVDSAGGMLFAVGGGTISLTTAFDFRSRTGDTRVVRMANQANTTLWTLGTANGEMFMGTGSNTFIGPGSLGSASATGTGIVYRAAQSTGHYFLIGASNMGNFAQIDENTTAGNMIGVSSTTGQWHRVRPSFDNSTGTSVAYTFFQLSPTINLTGGSTTLRGYAFTPTMTSSTGGSLAAFLHTAGYVAWDSVLSPSQITSNQNDYNPTGWNNGGAPHGASILRLNTDASRNLTSLTGGASGRLAIIANVGSFDIVLKNDDGATGTAANRFALNADVTLQAGKCALIWYDGTSSRWRINGF